MFLKARLPKHGGFEDGPSVAIKKMFCGHYNRLREMLSIHSIHLRSETGIAIPDEDAISGYVGYGGLIYVVDGSAPGKPAEWCPTFGVPIAGVIRKVTHLPQSSPC